MIKKVFRNTVFIGLFTFVTLLIGGSLAAFTAPQNGTAQLFSAGTPAVPNKLQAGPLTANQMVLKWSDNADNESGYRIERSSDGEGFVQIAMVPADSTEYEDSRVEPNKNYTYRIRAFNRSGNSEYSSHVTTSSPDAIPAAVSNVQVIATEPTEIVVKWQDNSVNEKGFTIERKKKGETRFTEITKTAANITQYIDKTVSAESEYEYRISAFNALGRSVFSDVTGLTTGGDIPNPPTNLNVFAESPTRVMATWDDNAINEAGYEVERRADNEEDFSKLTTTPPDVVFFRDNTVEGARQYEYRVRAINTIGTSRRTDAYTIITPEEETVVSITAGESGYRIATPGENEILTKFSYTVTGEDADIIGIALQLSDEQSSVYDLVSQEITLHKENGTQIGSAIFDPETKTAFTKLEKGVFRIEQNNARTLTVRGIIADRGGEYNLPSGNLIRVDYDGDKTGEDGNHAIGVTSGKIINPIGNDTKSEGIRVMSAYPLVQYVPLKSNETILQAGTKRVLYKAKITAIGGGIAIHKTTFSISKETENGSGKTSEFALSVFQNPDFTIPDIVFNEGQNLGGIVNAGRCYNGTKDNKETPLLDSDGRNAKGSFENSVAIEVYPDLTACSKEPTVLVISKGQTRWFKVTATIGNIESGDKPQSIHTQMEGDSLYPEGGSIWRAGDVDLDNNDNFIWSPATLGKPKVIDKDFTNGFMVPGLSSMASETVTEQRETE
ncbi:MAG: hypothetical protein COU08_02560 [Candidatus Harrisonbacteria bacterium CG10_big_fil_rev_8_21_14_0_10_42_17]|uniref:Fibronectin type-III domain-containing protein n=1 Tax=Candidatus Harrisonbacteria bacterium CG10_big_fil_rev_8_21_14_0_10_42_17 TaxID=1974584 RepID=A0A2M6WHV7_9BACT|nr:MAG: hypothetical protein COU08_02560 [Candidatus Harrisonbacteria bacterium CG10_big_fil_rev_8_21_14_0_10_42_17]